MKSFAHGQELSNIEMNSHTSSGMPTPRLTLTRSCDYESGPEAQTVIHIANEGGVTLSSTDESSYKFKGIKHRMTIQPDRISSQTELVFSGKFDGYTEEVVFGVRDNLSDEPTTYNPTYIRVQTTNEQGLIQLGSTIYADTNPGMDEAFQFLIEQTPTTCKGMTNESNLVPAQQVNLNLQTERSKNRFRDIEISE
jgi:hypothetical protein